MHPLLETLLGAARGVFPPVDGRIEVLAPVDGDHHAVVEFTGHAVVLTDRHADDLRALGADGFGGASRPDVLRRLAGPGGWIGSHDVVLVASGTGGGRLVGSTVHEAHPRVVRSRAHRHDVRVYADDAGVLTLGRGLVGRLEMSVELFDQTDAGRGGGRRLISEGRALVEPDSVVFAQVAPGNAASLRAFLSCGFVPIGAETLLIPSSTDSPTAVS